jgi:hypothetical protein
MERRRQVGLLTPLHLPEGPEKGQGDGQGLFLVLLVIEKNLDAAGRDAHNPRNPRRQTVTPARFRKT